MEAHGVMVAAPKAGMVVLLCLTTVMSMGCHEEANSANAPLPTVLVSSAPTSTATTTDTVILRSAPAAAPFAKAPPPEGVIVPTATRRVEVRPGDRTTSYLWLAEFDVDADAPEVKQALAKGAQTPAEAWLRVHADRVRAAGHPTTSYGRGFEYQPQSRGEVISVMVRPLGEGSLPNPSTTRIEIIVGPKGG